MNRSPVFVLDKYITKAPFGVAPEKAEHLNEKVSNIEIAFLDDRGDFVFEIAATTVSISAGALNLLWSAGYSYSLLYRGFVQAQQAGETEYRPTSEHRTADALRLYEWAVKGVYANRLENWPASLPQPIAEPVPASDTHMGTELFLVAVAWILLHEVGHVELGHPTKAVGATSKQEEHQADAFATDWLLSELTDDALITKRALGIAVANIVLVAIDLNRGSFDSSTHPPSYERLHRNLRSRQLSEESPVHAFVAVMIQAHLAVCAIENSLEESAPFDSQVDDMCFRLSRIDIRSPKRRLKGS